MGDVRIVGPVIDKADNGLRLDPFTFQIQMEKEGHSIAHSGCFCGIYEARQQSPGRFGAQPLVVGKALQPFLDPRVFPLGLSQYLLPAGPSLEEALCTKDRGDHDILYAVQFLAVDSKQSDTLRAALASHVGHFGEETLMRPPLDVWDSYTFDPALLDYLERHGTTIDGYFDCERTIFIEYDLGRGTDRPPMRPDNPFGRDYMRVWEELAISICSFSLRAWHYTRLTDQELDLVVTDGVHMSTPDSLRRRLDAAVEEGAFTEREASVLYDGSPFHGDQFASRNNRFWMTSHPVPVGDSGVRPLLGQWGGEVASMWIKDQTLLGLLGTIGRPRILELAVPIAQADCGLRAAKAVIATFARGRGALPEKSTFDLRVTSALPASSIMAIHTEHDPCFDMMAVSYPSQYVDADIGRWKALTGED